MNVDNLSAIGSTELEQIFNNDIVQMVFNALPGNVAILRPDYAKNKLKSFTYLSVNNSAAKAANFPFKGKQLSFYDDKLLFNAMEEALTSGNDQHFSESNIDFRIKKFGEAIWLEYIEKKNGNHLDSAAGKLAEEKILHLNASLKRKNRELQSLNNELKTFTSIAAHDYKETLHNLYTNLEYIIMHDARHLSNSGKANLRKAQTSIQKMKLLTDDIIGFASIQAMDSHETAVDLNQVIKSVKEALAEKISAAGAEFETDTLPVIDGFPFLLDMLFYQIIDNAVKFRNPEVQLHIRIAYHTTKEPHTDHDLHQITIADNGIGFTQDESSKIFDMFYRIHGKKFKGSGIGLAICKKIMTIHGGTIAMESEPDKGTAVCCFFPMNPIKKQ